jgi:alkylmercury lyase
MDGSSVDLRDLAETLVRSCPPLGEDEQRVVRAGQRALADGEALSVRRLGQVAGLTTERVLEVLERRPGLARFDEAGRVVGLLGLSVSRTIHRLRVGDRWLYAWCAWDALFVPRVIGRSADVASNCPIVGNLIRMVVTPDGISEPPVGDVSISFPVSCESMGDRGVAGACCRVSHFLSSRAAARRWLARQPGGVVLALDDASKLARVFVDEILFAATADGPVAATGTTCLPPE